MTEVDHGQQQDSSVDQDQKDRDRALDDGYLMPVEETSEHSDSSATTSNGTSTPNS
jgi:hypothetical protein